MRLTDMHGTAGNIQERSDRKERLAEIKERITQRATPPSRRPRSGRRRAKENRSVIPNMDQDEASH